MSEVKAIAALGRPGRTLAARLLPGQDVVEGIVGLIKEHEIKSGSVTALGSLCSAKVVWAGSMEFGDDPMEVAVFHEMEGPVELGAATGFFGTDDEGQVIIHLHGMIMDKEGNMRCGNLLPGSAPVLATAELTIQELVGVEFKPTLDPDWNHKFLHPRPVEEW